MIIKNLRSKNNQIDYPRRPFRFCVWSLNLINLTTKKRTKYNLDQMFWNRTTIFRINSFELKVVCARPGVQKSNRNGARKYFWGAQGPKLIHFYSFIRCFYQTSELNAKNFGRCRPHSKVFSGHIRPAGCKLCTPVLDKVTDFKPDKNKHRQLSWLSLNINCF